MIKIENLGYHTDCIARRLEGELIDRDSYIVLRTPRNPTYHWGNLLLFKDEPKLDDFDKWISAHLVEFGEHSGHVTFGWQSQEVGNVDRFVQNGFSLESESVLVLDELIPSEAPNRGLSIREIDSDKDWDAVLKLQILVSEGSDPSEGYVEFKTRSFETYRALSKDGAGDWWGAFFGDKLVGDLGLYFDTRFETGRFQSVETHPDFRRIGVCSELLRAAASQALKRNPNIKLVICTERDSDAERVYRKLGFDQRQLQHGVCLPHPLKTDSNRSP